jgi:hypothetical protein
MLLPRPATSFIRKSQPGNENAAMIGKNEAVVFLVRGAK